MILPAAPLPITPEILTLVAEIDEWKGAWRAFGSLAPERLSGLRRVATIESIGSSTRIEGSRLSDADVGRLLGRLEIHSFRSRDEEEVAGYAQVMETIFAHYDAIELTENHVSQLHRDLLAFSEKDARHRGAYKTIPNHVSAFDADGREIGVVFETATPFDTPHRMRELIEWTRREIADRRQHPLIVIAVFTGVFLEIHPFQDGNGRLSRALTTLLLLRSGYAYTPYSSLESVIESGKEAYYLALRRTQSSLRTPSPDWRPWLEFFLRALQTQKRRLEVKVQEERLMLKTTSALSTRILEAARDHGRLTIREAVALTGANRNTVKKHVATLVRENRLVQHGNGKGAWYTRA